MISPPLYLRIISSQIIPCVFHLLELSQLSQQMKGNLRSERLMQGKKIAKMTLE